MSKSNDEINLDRFKRLITQNNAHNVDRDITENRDLRTWHVRLWDRSRGFEHVKSDFGFITKEAAEEAVAFAKAFEVKET
jgi:hypothetical protein